MVQASFGRRALCGVLLLLFGWLPERTHRMSTEVTFKGAFLFNFARFTEWPADVLHPDTAVSACVIGDRAVADAFAKTVKGKQLAGRTIAVTIVRRPDRFRLAMFSISPASRKHASPRLCRLFGTRRF